MTSKPREKRTSTVALDKVVRIEASKMGIALPAAISG